MTAGQRAMRLQRKRRQDGLCVRCGLAHNHFSRRTYTRSRYCEVCTEKRRQWALAKNADELCVDCSFHHTRLNKKTGKLALVCTKCAARQCDAQRKRYLRKTSVAA